MVIMEDWTPAPIENHCVTFLRHVLIVGSEWGLRHCFYDNWDVLSPVLLM